MAIQTESSVPDHQKAYVNKRGATIKIKSTRARILSVCGVSVQASQKAIQIVCKTLYNHNIYLSAEEQAEN